MIEIKLQIDKCEDCPYCHKSPGTTCDGFPDALSDTYYCNKNVFEGFKFKPKFIFYGCPYKTDFTIKDIEQSREFEIIKVSKYQNNHEDIIAIIEKYGLIKEKFK
jgi:hypothetical protein